MPGPNSSCARPQLVSPDQHLHEPLGGRRIERGQRDRAQQVVDIESESRVHFLQLHHSRDQGVVRPPLEKLDRQELIVIEIGEDNLDRIFIPQFIADVLAFRFH